MTVKINIRASLIALVPILGFLAVAAMGLRERHDVYGAMQRMEVQVDLVTSASALVDELQRERAYSALHLGGEADATPALEAQRQRTDERLRQLAARIGAARSLFEAGTFDAIDRHVAQLAEMRTLIADGDATATASAAFYTDAIRAAAALFDLVGRRAGAAEVMALVAAYGDFVNAKERAAQEGALGTGVINGRTFRPPFHLLFQEAVARQEELIARFRARARPEHVALYDAVLADPAIKDSLAMRATVLELASTNDLRGLTTADWNAHVAARLDRMTEVEERLSADLIALTRGIGADAWRGLLSLAGVAAALLVATLVISGTIVRSITRPLTQLAHATVRLAEGDSAQEVPSTARGDEIGEVARAVAVFKANQIEMQRLREHQAAEQARQEQERRAAMLRLADDLEGKVRSVVRLVCDKAGEIGDRADGMGGRLDNAANRSLGMAEAAERTTTSVETVAAATEQLTGSIHEITQQAAHSMRIAQDAVSEVDGVNLRVQQLRQATESIGDVVSLINDIASQTNLLALNATIEAARAGDAGKGFAVVANEVKGLANQTARATEQIGGQIAQVQAATAEAVGAIAGVGRTIVTISEVAGAIAAAVEEQGAATREIASHVHSVSADAAAVRQDVQNIVAASASSLGAAIQVLWSATDLEEPADRLGREVDDFLRTVRGG